MRVLAGNLALAAACVAVAACGGSEGGGAEKTSSVATGTETTETSARGYTESDSGVDSQYEILAQRTIKDSFAAIKLMTRLSKATGETAGVRSGAASELKKLSDKLDAVEPPDNVSDGHDKIVAGLLGLSIVLKTSGSSFGPESQRAFNKTLTMVVNGVTILNNGGYDVQLPRSIG